ncbi:glycosyl hydrolase family 32 [Edwardsiella hoshinae]|uniref:Sucrose-6-phosphate hydrolase n=1 Tax=Edwardsiella hoshinae TaxID=93378 RepID=A0ABN4T002_9GAMM|nr:sucrose-6-phosphate hydrolase [Edwardsiella hoshinae]AOV96837.1 glycosyl hydrolase family 32 [Edwardsiella hoshinae]
MSRYSPLPAILQAVMRRQSSALHDRYYPRWHLAPVCGLMNDPNGFIWFAGRYHLFYQWNPLDCNHKYKCWGHWSSLDLVEWQHEPIALLPDETYDRNGCYSGSALDNHGTLTLCYTGNVKFPDGGRTAWQCLAVAEATGEFKKLGPVLAQPEGYTGHVRDPKVWRHGASWYMVLGAQDVALRGKVLLFTSPDLQHWQLLGEIAGNGINGLPDASYMWECPDLFALDGQHVLLGCPQGIKPEATRYLNPHACVWLAGDLDYATGRYTSGAYHEVDAGFEFYAPQTTLSPDGRRLLVGWMGVPDGEEQQQPTVQQGWLHQMTCPRELRLRNGHLYQQPARELQRLRQEAQQWHGCAQQAPQLAAQRIELMLSTTGPIGIDFAGVMWLELEDNVIRLIRRSLADNTEQIRYWHGAVHALHILCDHSSVEIFINDGEGVMSSRYFPPSSARLTITGSADIALRYWSLRSCMVK